MSYDYLIVGAGITGATVARVLAEAGRKVLLVERRNHGGGNCYDEYDGHGILIHKYGPHIFHTNHKEVWDFLSEFTEWRAYQHKVKAYVEGKLLPFPINIDTINRLYGLSLEEGHLEGYLDKVRERLERITNSKEAVIAKVGADLYEKFFKNYTLKQWGLSAEELAPLVCERIPVRFNREDRYFTDEYQGMPLQGYARLFEKMISHENIRVLLKTDYRDIANCTAYKALVYTGQIDEYFGYCHGRLGYRSLRFDFKNFSMPSFQDYAVINYPNDYEYTRITEYKKLTGQEAASTTVSYEYPRNEGDPFYPMPTEENQKLYTKYLKESEKLSKVVFAGRLGSYRYMNMDIACLEGLKHARELL